MRLLGPISGMKPVDTSPSGLESIMRSLRPTMDQEAEEDDSSRTGAKLVSTFMGLAIDSESIGQMWKRLFYLSRCVALQTRVLIWLTATSWVISAKLVLTLGLAQRVVTMDFAPMAECLAVGSRPSRHRGRFLQTTRVPVIL